MRILVIEDNRDIAANIHDFLEGKGHIVDAAGDGITGLHLALVNEYEAIVLDLKLPGLDGIEVCRKLRNEARKDTPVLMLTARDTLPDKLMGFESGADDYLVKPFALQELEARLQALSRRGVPGAKSESVQIADLVFNPLTLRVRRAGQDIDLSPIELKILTLLMRESRRVVTRNQIEAEVWGDTPPESDSIRAHIHTLRNAIDRPFNVALIHTVHGIGYRLADPDAL
jgi:DNA-binding response OmpR family regulator